MSYGAMLVYENRLGELEELYGTVTLYTKLVHKISYNADKRWGTYIDDFTDDEKDRTLIEYRADFYSYSKSSIVYTAIPGILSYTLPDGRIVDKNVFIERKNSGHNIYKITPDDND